MDVNGYISDAPTRGAGLEVGTFGVGMFDTDSFYGEYNSHSIGLRVFGATIYTDNHDVVIGMSASVALFGTDIGYTRATNGITKEIGND